MKVTIMQFISERMARLRPCQLTLVALTLAAGCYGGASTHFRSREPGSATSMPRAPAATSARSRSQSATTFPSLPKLGDGTDALQKVCASNTGHLERSEDGWIICVANQLELFHVVLDQGVVSKIFIFREGGEFKFYRGSFEEWFGAAGQPVSDNGNQRLRWTSGTSATDLVLLQGGIGILVHPSDSSEQATATNERPGLDLATAERAVNYQQVLAERGWRRIGDAPTSLVGREQQVYDYTLSADSGRCYAVLAIGGPGVEDANIGIYGAVGELAIDVDADRDAIASFCAITTEEVNIQTSSFKGSGPVFLVAYETDQVRNDSVRWPSWEGPRPRRPGRATGKHLTASALYRRAAQATYVVSSGSSHGSAVAVSQRHLLTNCHVLQTTEVLVKRDDKIAVAHVVRADPTSDRCIIATEDIILTPVSGVRRHSDLRIGETVYAVGAPRGQEGSISSGIISRFDKRGEINLVQTTAPISPGSSGGALYDASGNLIGITAFQHADAQNLNFAIAADEWWQ